jgi:hypothetical protein
MYVGATAAAANHSSRLDQGFINATAGVLADMQSFQL